MIFRGFKIVDGEKVYTGDTFDNEEQALDWCEANNFEVYFED